jgi:hypothetical protein
VVAWPPERAARGRPRPHDQRRRGTYPPVPSTSHPGLSPPVPGASAVRGRTLARSADAKPGRSIPEVLVGTRQNARSRFRARRQLVARQIGTSVCVRLCVLGHASPCVSSESCHRRASSRDRLGSRTVPHEVRFVPLTCGVARSKWSTEPVDHVRNVEVVGSSPITSTVLLLRSILDRPRHPCATGSGGRAPLKTGPRSLRARLHEARSLPSCLVCTQDHVAGSSRNAAIAAGCR